MLNLILLPLLVALCLPTLGASYRLPALASRDNHVLTPHGLHPAENVHHVPEGSRVHHTSTTAFIIDHNNNTIHTASIHATPTPTSSSIVPELSGWITFASWMDQTGSPVSSFSSTWGVPLVPATNNGQTIFLFNAIEPGAFNGILQPVLQFGTSAAGGGSFWGAASWYIIGTQVYHTGVTPVSPGQSLTGLMKIDSVQASTGTYTYHCSFTNVLGTALEVSGVPPLLWATETLEVYGMTASSDFPTGHVDFTGISITTLAAASPPVVWSVDSNDTIDGLSTSVVSNGPANAEIIIYFPISYRKNIKS